jgi:hypothetical protein
MNARVDDLLLASRTQVENLQRAASCIQRLNRMGMLVLHVRMTGACPPRIRIQNSPLCAQLNGAPYIHRNLHGVPEDVMACPLDGCQVEWIQRGH